MKKKIFLTGSNGRIGSYLKKKLKKNFVVIESDIIKGDNLSDDSYLKKIFKKNDIFAIIFCHGLNSTPLLRGKVKQISNLEQASIQKFFDVNFFLNLNVIKNYMKYQKKGRIMNFTSLYSIKSPKHYIYNNFSKELGYCASKSASNMMMKYLGTKYAKKYLFNSIVIAGVAQKKLDPLFLSGYNKNNPTGRMMKLEEVLPVVNFLLDEKNTHTNAQEIIVDGGWLSW
ncbi:SDR family oxidoreductase [Candidatus Pelagibacter bacterium nBUS_29]|uniref:SDR family oxidoreductase n=1 Tax=Candidatus Pelagibacter bacterium nBUS_29 TaxID=3374190 RepID=UPI003EBFAFAC